MSLDPMLLRGVSAAITSAGINATIGRNDLARRDAETALKLLRGAIETDQGHRELVERLVNDTEPRLSHEYDLRETPPESARG